MLMATDRSMCIVVFFNSGPFTNFIQGMPKVADTPSRVNRVYKNNVESSGTCLSYSELVSDCEL